MRQFIFSSALLKWFDQYGRHDLPWQKNITPYRVWVSEIMLQQTQVSTVIDYYSRFIKKFPTLTSLASASSNEVLHLWTGLGYYARARNLHRCAQLLVNNYQGKFPTTVEDLCALPGIGRSTAGAILSIALKQRAPILDGNVKRVLARFFAIENWTGTPKTQDFLWEHAEQLTPHTRVADYTQAIMDLGATVCTRRKPACTTCPLKKHCRAFLENRTSELPAPKPPKVQPQKKRYFVLLRHGDCVWLIERPSVGIWGGLWCFPEFASRAKAATFYSSLALASIQPLPSIKHTFSHYQLLIIPTLITLKQRPKRLPDEGVWYNIHKPPNVGLAAPIKKLIQQLRDSL